MWRLAVTAGTQGDSIKNEAELLKLLHKPMNEEMKDRCKRTSEDSNEFNLSNLDHSRE
jgi:hypothetical protein